MSEQVRVGAFPGSFNPPTIAHLAIAERFARARRLDRVDLIVSRVALAKEEVARPRLEDRLRVLQEVARETDGIGVELTHEQLLVDIARGYDSIVMGADKWVQIHDVDFYGGSADARDAAVSALPDPAVVPRPPFDVPTRLLLDLDPRFGAVSSTATRDGRVEWMAPAAARFDRETGAWTDPERYETWVSGR